MREALFAAYFDEGRDVGRIDVWWSWVPRWALDATELKVVLDVDTFSGAWMRTGRWRRAWHRRRPVLIVGAGADASW